LHLNRKFPWRIKLICPVQSLAQKKIRIFRNRESVYIASHPAPLGGALRNVTDAERDAVDADGAMDERA